MDILEQILAVKTTEVAQRKRAVPLSAVRARALDAPPARDFAGALRERIGSGRSAVIAELKRASPSKGLIREHFDVEALALSYAAGGATCLSVLTDESFFLGSDGYLRLARQAVALPLLRKDFVIDAYQVYEARLLGADAVLLIAAALTPVQVVDLAGAAQALGLAVLIEVHEESELAAALAVPDALIGVNNRDLRTFEVDLETSIRLRAQVPAERLLVSESGIHGSADIKRLARAGIHAYLIGESLMREPDPGLALQALLAGA